MVGELRRRDIQPNQWVALLYFESQKAKQNRSDKGPEEGFDVSGVAASPFIIYGPQGAGALNRAGIRGKRF
jgi:hypothetical protein